MSVFRANNASPDRTWSVPHPRPAWTELDEAPTERLYEAEPEPAEDPPPPRPRRGGVMSAVLLAVLALIVSAVALYFAWRAMAVAGTRPDAAPSAAAAPSYVSPSEPALSAEPTEPAASAPSSAAASVPASASADAGYPVSYAEQPLQVQVGCAAVMYLDLDEPRADADQQRSDLRYDSRCGTGGPVLTLAPGAEAAGQVTDPETDAAGCAQAIRTSPLGVNAEVPVQKGTLLCVLTSATDAEDRGDRPRMVLVEVTEAGEGSAAMRATSWTVPG
jgi:cytoskeletal protein RodZ